MVTEAVLQRGRWVKRLRVARLGGRGVEPRDDAVDGVRHRVELHEIVVVEPEPNGALAQLVFEQLRPLDQGEVVGVQVVAQSRGRHDGVLVDLEYLREPLAHEARDLVAVDRAAATVGLSRHRPSPRADWRRCRRAHTRPRRASR